VPVPQLRRCPRDGGAPNGRQRRAQLRRRHVGCPPGPGRGDRVRGAHDRADRVKRKRREPPKSDGGPRQKPVSYGVIPAGGLGTRFLPISRTVPKELLPIIDTPVIELVVAEMAAAGITRVVIVNAPGKESLDAYFRPNARLERRLG